MRSGHIPPTQGLDPNSHGISSGIMQNILDHYVQNPRQGPTNPLEKRNVTTWDFPDSQEGKVKFLGNTVDDMMWTANQTFYTEEVCPWVATDNIYFEWQNFENNAHIVGINPHQTPARMISQKKQVRRGALLRRGIMLQFEHDHARSMAGKEALLHGMFQIARSYQETANAEVIRALLHAHSFIQQFVRENGIVARQDHLEYLGIERDRWAVCQKRKNGIEILISEIASEANRYRGEFDTFLAPERMLNYVTLVRPEKTDFWIRGERGPDAVDNIFGHSAYARMLNALPSADRLESQRLMGQYKVWEVRAFHVDGVQPLDLLAKTVQIGEYNVMHDKHIIYDKKYNSRERDIMIFDEDRDKFSLYTLKNALDTCSLFDPNGILQPIPASADGSYSDAALKDFLTRYDGSSVQYFGDINITFLSSDLLEHMGQVGVARMSNGDAKMEEDLKLESEISFKKLQSYFGTDNFFLSSKTTFNDTFNNASGANQVLIQKALAPERDEATTHAANVSAEKLDVLKQMFKAQLPVEQVDKVDDIMDNPASKVQAARELRQLFVTTAIGKIFDNRAQFESFFDTRITKHYLDDPLIVLGINAPARVASDYYYGAPGQTLPEGHSYVDPNHAYEAPVDFPTRVEHFPHFRKPVEQLGGSTEMYREYENTGEMLQFGKNDTGLHRMRAEEETGKNPLWRAPYLLSFMAAFQKNLDAINALGCSRNAKIIALCFLGATVTKQSLERLIANNLPFPMKFLIARPHATYRGRTGVLVKSRGGAGNMYWGHAECEVEHDAARMIGLVHTVAYMGCLIRNPENVYCQPNMFIDKYFGGLGMRAFSPDTYDRMSPNGQGESIICIAVPYNEGEFPQPMDIAGSYYTDYEMGLLGSSRTEAHYSTHYRYNHLFNFVTRLQSNDIHNTPTVLPDDTHINRNMWPGAQYMWNRKLKKYGYCEHNKGHWGDIVYSGCHQARTGKDQYLDPARLVDCF
jgi:hypothetical protein